MVEIRRLETDLLIVGGGTAGCYAALTAGEAGARVLVVDRADIHRSGCLAAGVNALNAYIAPGKTPQDYVDYARRDADGIVRGDLLLTMSEGLNRVTRRLEELGLVFLKDVRGNYVSRGWRNIKINGENIKPLLAEAVLGQSGVTVLDRVNMTDYIVRENRVVGAVGLHIEEEAAYVITAKAVLCATGGAAGLYRPNNPGHSRHKMWYCPFNTGAGYAMGIRAGAEMTTMEMRFIALRCKDTIAPTGTIAQGVGADQVNALGESYAEKYGLTTSGRLYGTVMENLAGRGPCYLKTEGITGDQETELKKAYLNMAPSQTLKWLESGRGPAEENVEIEGTEPYIVGGHTASGYWVDTDRATTLPGLYAAGDVAGGSPQKYVTGALVEGEIAARAALRYIEGQSPPGEADALTGEALVGAHMAHLENPPSPHTARTLEEAMQKVMDTYAGGIGANYSFNGHQLRQARAGISRLETLSRTLRAGDMGELYRICQVKERLTVCACVIAHLEARRETRWHCFAENRDFPEKNDRDFLCYVNSRLTAGRLEIVYRSLVGEGERYEHTH